MVITPTLAAIGQTGGGERGRKITEPTHTQVSKAEECVVAAALFGLTRGETATAIMGIALVAGAVKAYRERRRQRAQKEAIDKAIQLWEALMAKQQYEMPAAEWRRLRPFYTLTVEALKNERDRAARRGGVKQVRENGEGA